MATILNTPTIRALLPTRPSTTIYKTPKAFCASFRHNAVKHSRLSSLPFSHLPSPLFVKFVPFASSGETETTETQEEVEEPQQVEDILDGAAGIEDGTSDDDAPVAEEVPTSAILLSLQSYKEALSSNDESRVAEIESFLKSIEEEKIGLERKLASLSDELSAEKSRVLRISADFDNFRKRTERERLSTLTNAQGEVVESLLPVLDNFERAKAQIKVETEGEEKINNSYQSIYKQFVEILSSLGVVPVETVGNPFDPLLHEAIMREDSNEYEEGIIIDEFRRGFRLDDRLLRPSMVKVSAGPGPAKSEQVESSEGHDTLESTEEGTTTESDST
ncbi:protein GrpE [Juglans microcarpa x Juglans regia]|uniref:protein GrpE n=1 Tax=Juglans microcarpa x Juglans regia TaxID=2249226 RepID=UPI001B7F626E|nr:protein GrpE [Juglans microcarpa x Juglans regia]